MGINNNSVIINNDDIIIVRLINKMSKEYDKYYTPSDIAEHCYNKVLDVIGKDNISEIIEPSAGAGVFLDIDESIKGFDIAPEDNRIKKVDFLELELGYQEGRLFLGNPPFGRCLNLAQKFYKHCVSMGDYIAFILPISQYNTNKVFYEFDLIYSEDLGIQNYSGKDLHCVFNIYKRPLLGLNSKPERKKLREITIYRQDRKDYNDIPFDVRICYWGHSAGKVLKDINEHYAGEYKIQIHNDVYREEIKDYIENYDWNSYMERNHIAMKRLKQFEIIQIIKEKFPELN